MEKKENFAPTTFSWNKTAQKSSSISQEKKKSFNENLKLNLSLKDKVTLIKAVISDKMEGRGDVAYSAREILYIRDYTPSLITMSEEEKNKAARIYDNIIPKYDSIELTRNACRSLILGVDSRYVDGWHEHGLFETLYDDFKLNKKDPCDFIERLKAAIAEFLEYKLYNAAVNAVNILREVEKAYQEEWDYLRSGSLATYICP